MCWIISAFSSRSYWDEKYQVSWPSRSWAYRHHESQLMIPVKMSLLSQPPGPGLQGAVNRYQSPRSKDESTFTICRWNTLSIKSESVSESLISCCIFPSLSELCLSRLGFSFLAVAVNSLAPAKSCVARPMQSPAALTAVDTDCSSRAAVITR